MTGPRAFAVALSDHVAMTTARMEALSDGVFAVAITLLSLDLPLPAPGRHSLAHSLLHNWPHYAAYVVSFLTVGIVWINHHAAVRRLVRPDHGVLLLNLLLLMSVVTIPFATELVAAYLRHTGADVATAVYSGDLAWMAISFVAFNWFTLFRRRQLLDPLLSQGSPRRVFARGAVGVVPYLVCIGLAFVSPYVSLAIGGLISVYYALPVANRDVANGDLEVGAGDLEG